MLDIMEEHLKNDGFRCATIKGNVKPETRAQLVDQFNTDPKGFEVC
jgi:SNF2 family DNA or RNA helicase